MGKYANLEKDIFTIVAETQLLNSSIRIFPGNFVATDTGNQFLRVSIIPSNRGLNLKSISGLLIVDIFIPSGGGLKLASTIADTLDSKFVGKSVSTSLNNVTQFGNSSLDHKGVDKDSPALHRSIYTIPFNFFGV